MKISSVFTFLAMASPVASFMRGYDYDERELKGNDNGGNTNDDILGGAIPGLPNIPSTCFSEIATVQVQGTEGPRPVMMKDLQVGDKVLTGSNTYEAVYAFGHYQPDKMNEFLQFVTTKDAKPLEMTGEHLVFLHNKVNPVRADSVQVGDVLRTTAQNSGRKVTSIKTIQRQGLYAPLTNEGSLVVDGIVASSYISLQAHAKEFVQVQQLNLMVSQHNYVHMTLAPLRLMCQGVSANMFCETRDENGMPYYIRYGMDLQDWVLQNESVLVQVFFLTLFTFLAGACLLLEGLFGPAYGPLALAVIGVTYAVVKVNGIAVRAIKTKTV